MVDPTKYNPADLLPHAPPFVLVDEVLEWQQGHASAAVNVSESSLFHTKQGVPAHVGLEYMAQTCGVYSGLHFLINNLPIRMGYLLGTRDYRCQAEYFASGERLIVNISEVMRQGQIGVFNCAILRNGEEIAAAQLTVYQSDDTAKK